MDSSDIFNRLWLCALSLADHINIIRLMMFGFHYNNDIKLVSDETGCQRDRDVILIYTKA